MGDRHTTAPPAPGANDTAVVRPQAAPQAGDGTALADLLHLLADASAHAYAGDRARATYAVRRALAILDDGLPANERADELARLRAQADPATTIAFHERRGAA